MKSNVDQKLAIKMILDEIKNKNIPLNIESTQLPPLQVSEQKKEKIYEAAPISVFDAFTLILFTLNLMGMINISWIVAFLPLMFPYIVIGITWCVTKLITKIKNRKKNDVKTN